MEEEEKGIDLKRLIRGWLRGAWVWIVSGILGGIAGFYGAKHLVEPLYESSVLFYVNNSANQDPNEDITTGQMEAAKQLVKTYGVILQNRSTLEQVIRRLDGPYTYKELSSCLSVSAVNETEVMRVSVKTKDPNEAAEIANRIAEVLPVRVSEIIEGASMRVLDEAYANANPVSKSPWTYGLICGMVGVILSSGVLVLVSVLDDKIRGTESLQGYTYSVLVEIPCFSGKGYEYGYYKKERKDV